MYNQTQKNLLLAGEFAKQMHDRLRHSLNADESKDEPELRPDLRKLLTDAESLSNRIYDLRQAYDDGKFEMKAGDKVDVCGNHPHNGAEVTLISYGPYGLAYLNLIGWLVRRADSGEEFYCQPKNLWSK